MPDTTLYTSPHPIISGSQSATELTTGVLILLEIIMCAFKTHSKD
jgi:hypothetical protein